MGEELGSAASDSGDSSGMMDEAIFCGDLRGR